MHLNGDPSGKVRMVAALDRKQFSISKLLIKYKGASMFFILDWEKTSSRMKILIFSLAQCFFGSLTNPRNRGQNNTVIQPFGGKCATFGQQSFWLFVLFALVPSCAHLALYFFDIFFRWTVNATKGKK